MKILQLSGHIILSFYVCFLFSCKKEKPYPPVVSTASVTEISYRSAVSGGNVSNEGGGQVTGRGICWNTSAKPTITNSITIVNGTRGAFTSDLTQLSPSIKYYVRAYATNEGGTSYGNEITFTTSQIEIPVLTTTEVTSITQTTALAEANVTDDKGGDIIEKGVCWSKAENPTITDSKSTEGTGSGIFSSTITGLTGNTTYYLKAYATNSAGTAYGNQVSFKTNPVIPTVSTSEVTSITFTSVMSGGNITDDGGGLITARGVCWSSSANPTTDSSKTSDGAGIGPYTSVLTGLIANSTYYVRAYATNSAGTSYGNEISFITPAVPVLSILSITSITSTTISTTCSVSSDAEGSVNSRGVCWSTSGNPTIDDNKTTDGDGTGDFTSILAGLTGNTTYYLRAYATNSSGTIYGNLISVITAIGLIPPTAITNMATLISPIKATLNGTVNGFSQSTAVSFEYGTSTSYGSIMNDHHIIIAGSGENSVSETLNNLKPGTQYHYRVKAEGPGGTTYGNDIIFTTLNIDPISFNPSLSYGIVIDIDENSYKTIHIGTQIWMAENLKTTRYSDGTNIPNPPFVDLTTPGYCWYNNSADFKAVYGALYNWYAVNTGSNGGKNICPVGWHVPSYAEWTTLMTFLGGESVAGGKLKEAGVSHWKSPNTGATNESGFTALPGGCTDPLGSFNGFAQIGYWLSTTEDFDSFHHLRIYYSENRVIRYTNLKRNGNSVRCLKD